MLYRYLKPLLFRLDAEHTHELTTGLLARVQDLPAVVPVLRRRYGSSRWDKPVTLAGLQFPNAVGLAAGFDKNAVAVRGLAALGFGHLEVGTVTPRAQAGNPRPRIVRLPADQALVNWLGFNNQSARAAARRLQDWPVPDRHGVILGVNIGRNKDTPAAESHHDYTRALATVYSAASYVTINISSPNTPGLRDLQHGSALDQLLDAVCAERNRLTDIHGVRRPLFLKISPDLNRDQLKALCATVLNYPVDALIATNTTSRRGQTTTRSVPNRGGLSGQPLFEQSTGVLAFLYQHLDGCLPLIGVGGVHDGATAYAKIRAGASAIQLLTGLIYEGPGIVTKIKRELTSLLNRDGFARVEEAVGTAASDFDVSHLD